MGIAIGWTRNAKVCVFTMIKDSGSVFKTQALVIYIEWVLKSCIYKRKSLGKWMKHSNSSIPMFGYNWIIFEIVGKFVILVEEERLPRCVGVRVVSHCYLGRMQDGGKSDHSAKLLYSSAFGEVEFDCPKPSGTQNTQNEFIPFLSKLNFSLNYFRLSNIMTTPLNHPNTKSQSLGWGEGETDRDGETLKRTEIYRIFFNIEEINIE